MNINTVIKHIENSQTELVNHNIYNNIKTIDDLKLFMENHIFAVWDTSGIMWNCRIVTSPSEIFKLKVQIFFAWLNLSTLQLKDFYKLLE